MANFYVDEASADNSAPIITGPDAGMTRSGWSTIAKAKPGADSNSFEAEMTGRAAAAGLARNDSGENVGYLAADRCTASTRHPCVRLRRHQAMFSR